MKTKFNFYIYICRCEEGFSLTKQPQNNVGDCFAAKIKSAARNDIKITGGAQ